MDKSIVARAQQIAESSPEGMTIQQAAAEAIMERYGSDPKLMAEAFAAMTQSAFKAIRKNSYEVPEQATLLDVPKDIVITTPNGDLLVRQPSGNQAVQWIDEGTQYHGSQHKRFQRLGEQMKKVLPQIDPDLPLHEQLKQLEQGESQ